MFHVENKPSNRPTELSARCKLSHSLILGALCWRITPCSFSSNDISLLQLSFLLGSSIWRIWLTACFEQQQIELHRSVNLMLNSRFALIYRAISIILVDGYFLPNASFYLKSPLLWLSVAAMCDTHSVWALLICVKVNRWLISLSQWFVGNVSCRCLCMCVCVFISPPNRVPWLESLPPQEIQFRDVFHYNLLKSVWMLPLRDQNNTADSSIIRLTKL